MSYDCLVVGCGLSGAVTARYLAEENDQKVLIVEKRDHIGGNCYDYVDETGIRIHKYGPHLFDTNNERVWRYVQRFSDWTRFELKVQGMIDGRFVPVPPNISTINALCSEHLSSQSEADDWLAKNQMKYDVIENSFQMATSRVGVKLYEKIFKNYTFKQWGKYPEELDPSVLARIPVRNNFDDRYFTDKYQALPTHGYTKIFENMLNHENITVKLSTDYHDMASHLINNGTIIYTGPIDAYFAEVGYPRLEYRSLNFHAQRIRNVPFYQPGPVVNYPGLEVRHTRTVEYKHFLDQDSPHTTIVSETSCDDGDPYYPVPNKRNLDLYERYRKLSEESENIHFVGRLAGYKYFNMDEAILNALKYCDDQFQK